MRSVSITKLIDSKFAIIILDDANLFIKETRIVMKNKIN
jgi:hypothetical protein